MKWVHVLHGWPLSKKGGVGLYVEALAKAQTERGIDVTIITPKQSKQKGVETHFGPYGRAVMIHTPPPKSWSGTWKSQNKKDLFNLLHQINPDVIHVHHLDGVGLDIWTHTPATSVRMITLHDYAIPCARGQLYTVDKGICNGPAVTDCSDCLRFELQHNPLTHMARRFLKPWSGLEKRARQTLNQLKPNGSKNNIQLRLDAAKKTLDEADVLLGPSLDLIGRFKRMGFNHPRHLPLPLLRKMQPKTFPSAQPLKVLFASSIIPSKGLHVLIDAVESFPTEVIGLTVAGHGSSSYGEEMKKRIDRNQNMTWLGAVSHDHIGDLIGDHHVLALPSLWPENAPIIVREALDLGRYVICSSEGGAKEFGHPVGLVKPGSVQDVVNHLNQIIDNSMPLPISEKNPSMTEHIDALIRISDQAIAKRSHIHNN